MMKRVIVLGMMAAVVAMGNAQPVRNNLLKGYKSGDKLEKGVYTSDKDSPRFNTWYGAYNAKAAEAEVTDGPTIGEPLSYEGYKEGGPSINLAGDGQVNRVSVYSLTKNNREYAKGAYYLAFLVNFQELGAAKFYDFVGLDINPLSRAVRGKVLVAREGADKIRFGVALRTDVAEGTGTYDYNKTHLLVLKVDYEENQATLYVNPDLNGGEPADGLVIAGGEDDLKYGLKSVYYRYRKGYKGNMGSFRFVDSWDAVIGK